MVAPKRAASASSVATTSNKKAKNVSGAAALAPRGILKKPSNGLTVASTASKNARHEEDDASHGKLQSGRTSNGLAKGKARENNAAESAAIGSFTPSLATIPQKPAIAFEVVAGSYERILYGMHCTPIGAGASTEVEMEPIFQFPAHLTSVKCAAASPNGRWLVTGSTDDVVKVWDFRRRKEVGGLVGHDGDITCLTFSSDKYLVSASADGTLCFFRTKDWSLLRRFKGHKGNINHVSVHPQGRVALTVSKDRCLRLWDLLGKGTGKDKGSTSTRLGAEGDVVRWNVKGDRFAVILDREVRLYTTSMVVLQTLTSRSRFHDIAFVDIEGVEILLVACDDGKVRIYRNLASEVPTTSLDADGSTKDEGEPGHIAELVGHTNRVKALSIVQILSQQLCTTISSDGTIKVFNLSTLKLESSSTQGKIQEIAASSSFDTNGSRLTCLTAVAVKDDRTTYADSIAASADSGSDSESDDNSDDEEDVDLAPRQTNVGQIGLEDEEEESSDIDSKRPSDDENSQEEWTGFGGP